MASLIQYGNIYHEGLFQGTFDLRGLTQHKYGKQTILPKHLNVTTTLTSFLAD